MTRTRNHCSLISAVALLASLSLFSVAACGSSSKNKGADEPVSEDESSDEGESSGVADTETSDPGSELMPDEKFDEVKRFFERKGKFLTRCFTEAIDAGEANKRASGHITVMMTIQKSGTPTKVRAVEVDPKSATLENCVIEHIKGWTVTTLPKPMDYSHTFAFGTL